MGPGGHLNSSTYKVTLLKMYGPLLLQVDGFLVDGSK